MKIKKIFREKFGFFEDGTRMTPLDWGYREYNNLDETLRDLDCLPTQKHEESIDESHKAEAKKPVVNDLKIIGFFILGAFVFLIVFLVVFYLSKSFS